jgi:hypothetical protein
MRSGEGPPLAVVGDLFDLALAEVTQEAPRTAPPGGDHPGPTPYPLAKGGLHIDIARKLVAVHGYATLARIAKCTIRGDSGVTKSMT